MRRPDDRNFRLILALALSATIHASVIVTLGYVHGTRAMRSALLQRTLTPIVVRLPEWVKVNSRLAHAPLEPASNHTPDSAHAPDAPASTSIYATSKPAIALTTISPDPPYLAEAEVDAAAVPTNEILIDYPAELANARLGGKVVADLYIARTGFISSITTHSEPRSEALEDAIRTALSAIAFKAAVKDGLPVASHKRLLFEFSIDETSNLAPGTQQDPDRPTAMKWPE